MYFAKFSLVVFVNSQKKTENIEKSQKSFEKSEEILQKTGKMVILFVKPKILTSGSLKYLKKSTSGSL